MRLALSERELFAVNAEQVRVFRFDGSQQRSWNLNLKFVSSIAVHENELFVLGSSEFGLTVVRVYHTSGSFTRHFTLPRFHPTTMAVSASHIVLADSDARRILVLGHDGVKIGSFVDDGTADIALWDELIFTRQRFWNEVRVYSMQGTLLRKWDFMNGIGATVAMVIRDLGDVLFGKRIDSQYYILRYSPHGDFQGLWPAEITLMNGMAVHKNGRMFSIDNDFCLQSCEL